MCSLQEANEHGNVSLTVQREIVDFKLEFAQFQTDMLEIHLEEVKDTNEKNLAKDHILRVLFYRFCVRSK
jgi:hypothetical protein